jgi:ribonuclease P protein component
MLVAPARDPEERTESDPVRRIGITASRKVGGAVVRNRVKRGVRDWFRRSRELLPPDVDVVVIARRPAASLSGRDLQARLSNLAVEASGQTRRSPRG